VAKAQEAAAWIERQLDNLVGLAALSTVNNASRGGRGGGNTTMDPNNDNDDDFFSLDEHRHHDHHDGGPREVITVGINVDERRGPSTMTSVVGGMLQNGGEDKDNDDCNCVIGMVGDGNGWDDADKIPLDDDYDDDFVGGGMTTVEAEKEIDGDGNDGGPSIATTNTSTTRTNMTKKLRWICPRCGLVGLAWLGWHGTARSARHGSVGSARHGLVCSAQLGESKKIDGEQAQLAWLVRSCGVHLTMFFAG
jgi:hypothetical protein